ncbi:hypothetical protein ACHAWX_000301 [Stephanocyclus meneghinianus]
MVESNFDIEYGQSNVFRGQHGGKINRDVGMGNFVAGSNGDIVAARSISKHGQQRIKERGLSQRDALKDKRKSGAVVSDDGKIVTVIPESWKKNAGSFQRKINQKNSRKPVRTSKVPDEKSLPIGHCVLPLDIPPSVIGIIIGKQHSNIKKMIQSCPGTYYDVESDIMTIWGLEESVKKLSNDITSMMNDIHGVRGPQIPEGKLPPGHTKTCILLADCDIPHVLGRGKENLKKIRDENPNVIINLNNKTREIYVVGETDAVNKVCQGIDVITAKSEEIRIKTRAWKERAGKESYDQKLSQYENDMKAFQSAITLADKQKEMNCEQEYSLSEGKALNEAGTGKKLQQKKKKA